jgi:hypothetical protein
MSQVQTGSEAAAAALVGSFATFSLIDVLDLLARTGHTGELQVVGRGVDHRLWVDAGDLLETETESTTSSLFDLACIEEGWFYFTSSAAKPDGRHRVGVQQVLEELGPQVGEWRELVRVLPPDAMVKMSSSTPSDEVQIRADQWQVLSLVGNPGKTVREVIGDAPLHPLDTLRTLRELANNHLILVEHDEMSSSTSGPPTLLTTPVPPLGDIPAPPPPVSVDGAAEEADAFTGRPSGPTPATPEASDDADAGSGIDAPAGGAAAFGTMALGPNEPMPPLQPFDARSSAPPVPQSPENWPESPTGQEEFPPPPVAGSFSMPTQSSVLPPPISGDPWSTPVASKELNGDDAG